MQMRPGGAPGGANAAYQLALLHAVAFFDQKRRAMQESAVQTIAMIDHQQFAFESERLVRRQNHRAICRGGKWCAALARRDIDARMIATRLSPVDPLRAEPARNAAPYGPDKVLLPSGAAAVDCARGIDACEFRAAQRHESSAWTTTSSCSIDMFDLPIAPTDGEVPRNCGAAAPFCNKAARCACIAVKRHKERAILCNFDMLAIECECDPMCLHRGQTPQRTCHPLQFRHAGH